MVIEATGNAAAVVDVLSPYVDRVVIANPKAAIRAVICTYLNRIVVAQSRRGLKKHLTSALIKTTFNSNDRARPKRGKNLKPSQFHFMKPASLHEVFELLDRYGEDARLIAGGQSLLPALNMRLSAPEVLIDLAGQTTLHGIGIRDNVLRIGALTTYSKILASSEVRFAAPLLHQALPWVAHHAIRNRGTIGGSLANADPAAEMPACMLALDARLEATSRSGHRKIPATEFFHGLFETDLKLGEILTAVEIPLTQGVYRSHFLEFSRRLGDFAMAGLATRARVDGDVFDDVRLAYCGVDTRPIRARAAERVLNGRSFSDAVIEEVKSALADDLSPSGDLQTTGEMKVLLSQVLAQRALTAMVKGEDR